MSAARNEDIMLKFVHTADWHLGRQFKSFAEQDALTLSRARLEVLERILGVAERNVADFVLCAGDLFDEPDPRPEWWQQAAERLARSNPRRPVFLLPGNHDPLVPESVWAPGHEFRARLPAWVHVVDRADFRFDLPAGAVLYGVPCTSRAGARDPTLSIPAREPGDERIRIGLVHGSTFDARDFQTNFPIDRDAAVSRGLDYLALGDTHGFRFIPADRLVPPTIYPGAPEPTAFDEQEAGHVAVVFVNRQRRASVRAERVAHWTWEELTVATLAELRTLALRGDLANRVLRLSVAMRVSAPEYDEAERLLADLSGTPARSARVGVLELDRQGLELETASIEQHCAELSPLLRATVGRLAKVAEDPLQRPIAERALYHLYRTAKGKVS
jgi:DNA repair exonuclease SbcCD nuclease subunit